MLRSKALKLVRSLTTQVNAPPAQRLRRTVPSNGLLLVLVFCVRKPIEHHDPTKIQLRTLKDIKSESATLEASQPTNVSFSIHSWRVLRRL
jgi:hypothetical protein